MSDVALSSGESVLFILVALFAAALLLDGAYQVVTTRQGLLPLERLIRKREPASADDRVLQGAAKMLQAAGVAFVAGPSVLFDVTNSAAAVGASFPPLSHLPVAVYLMVTVALFGSLILGLVCIVVAFVLITRINFVPVEPKVFAS